MTQSTTTAAAPLLAGVGLQVDVAGRTLVRGLDLQVQAGQRWVLLGRNGSGKSCLLEVLLGLRPPAAGHVQYAGQPLQGMPLLAAARHRAFLPQQAPLPFADSVLQAVLAGRHPHRMARQAGDSPADLDVALRTLAVLALTDRAHQTVESLSGGERQRVALATLLVQATPLLLLDEPLNHLDLAQQGRLLAHLQALALAGHAVVCSLHDLNQALAFATHVVLLDGAGGVQSGTAEALLTARHLQGLFGVPLCEVVQHGQRWLLPAPAGGLAAGAGA